MSILHDRRFRGGAVLAAAALAIALAGCSGGSDSGTATTAPPSGTTTMGSGPSGGAVNPMGAPGAPTGMPGMPGQTQVASAAAPGKPAPGATSAVPPAHRPDPFKPWWNTTPPPTPVLSEIAPARIAMYGSERPEIQPGIEIHEVPTRRVAGVLSGSGVYALLDGPEGQIVVKPGDPVGDYRVDSITGDAVTLKRVVKLPAGGTQTYTQVIPLTDQGASVSQYSGPAMGAPGMGAGRPPFMGGGFRGRGKMGGAEGIE